jgi:hypothetical protein
MSKIKTSQKQITRSIAIIIALVICLCAITFALMVSEVSVDEHSYKTGAVSINLNDGNPIIEEEEFEWKAGNTIAKEFFIENNSTCDVYYKLYFDEVESDLAQYIQIKIVDGETTLYSGTAYDLDRISVDAVDKALEIGERKTLTAYFTCPEDASREIENWNMSFRICADAVQAKNNPDKLFD